MEGVVRRQHLKIFRIIERHGLQIQVLSRKNRNKCKPCHIVMNLESIKDKTLYHNRGGMAEC